MEKITHNSIAYSIELPLNATPNPKGEVYVICPICTPTREPRHQKEKKCAVNIHRTPNPWRCNHCGAAGYIVDEEYMAKSKIKPLLERPRTDPVSPDIMEWFEDKRKIKEATIKKFKIRSSQEVVYQGKNKNPDNIGQYLSRKCINFPYFKNDLLVNVKYRDQNKNFKLISGADKILYNIDSIVGHDYVVIVEGEFDAMAFDQSGLTSVVSVPNGATITPAEKKHYEEHGVLDIQSNINLDYLDKHIEELNKIEIIYIATDSDAAGVKLREELARRLGKERCYWIRFDKYESEDGEKCKDANDVLKYHGEKTLAASIHSATPYPIEGVYAGDAFLEEMLVEFDSGRKKGLPTGYVSLNAHFNWMRGWLVVMNGHPGEGKSSLLFNLILISTILYEWKWGLYCPENYPPKNIVDTMAEILVGNTADETFDTDTRKRMSKTEYETAIRNHIGKHIYFVDREKGFTPEELREKKRQMVKQYGIVGFFTDPWKNLLHNYHGMRDDQYLGRELGEEVRLTTKYNLINLIAHHPPNPIRNKDGEIKVPTQFDLTGGAVWNQTVFQIGTVHRQNRMDRFNTITQFHVNKVKEQKLAGLPTGDEPILLRFDRRTNRFYERADINDENSKYNIFPIKDFFDTQETIEGF